MTDIANKDASSKWTTAWTMSSALAIGIVIGLGIFQFGFANAGVSEAPHEVFAVREGIPASVLAANAVREGRTQEELLKMLEKATATRRFDKTCSPSGFEDPAHYYPCRDWNGYRVVERVETNFYFKVIAPDQVIKLDPDQKNPDAEDFLDIPKLIRIFDR